MMIMKLTLPLREIGVHLAAKVFEEAVREKSSMVTNLDIFKKGIPYILENIGYSITIYLSLNLLGYPNSLPIHL